MTEEFYFKVKVKEMFDFAEMGARPVCLYTGNHHEFDVNNTVLVATGYGRKMPQNYYMVKINIYSHELIYELNSLNNSI